MLAVTTTSCGDNPSSSPERGGTAAAHSTSHPPSKRSKTVRACHRAPRELKRGVVAVLNAAKAAQQGAGFIGRYVRVDTPTPGAPAPFLGGAYVLSAWVKLAGVTRLTWVVNRRMLTTGKGAVPALDPPTRDGSDPRARPSSGRQFHYADAIRHTAAYASARSCIWDAGGS